MAAPAIASETTFSGSGTNHALTVPFGMAENDIDLIYANVWGSDGNSIAVPAGYTLIHRQLHSSDGEFVAMWRLAAAVPATTTIVTDSNLNMAARRLRITGAAATLLAALNAQASAQENVDDPDSPSVTTTVNECLVLLALADTWGDADPYAEPTGATQQGTNQDQSEATLCLAFFTQTTAGATGAKEWVGASANDEFATSTIAIAPPAAGGSATITADQGSYTLTGQDAATRRTHILPADQGAYVLTGQDATLRRTYVMTAEQGSYVLTGQDADLIVTAAPAPAPEAVPAGGGGMPPFHPDNAQERRARRQERHLKRTVEIAAEGWVVSPDLQLDEAELTTEEEALAVLVIGLSA